MKLSNTRPATITIATAVTALISWIWFASTKQDINRRIAYVALSRSGRWTSAGTAQGRIAIWDRQNHQREFHIGQGALNDLQFSPDERFLAVANRGLQLSTTDDTAPLHVVRSDDRNYGTVRFSADGKNLLTVTGIGTIETLSASSGKLRTALCCSTIYGEVAFTPDERLIVNAGHWPALWDIQSS